MSANANFNALLNKLNLEEERYKALRRIAEQRLLIDLSGKSDYEKEFHRLKVEWFIFLLDRDYKTLFNEYASIMDELISGSISNMEEFKAFFRKYIKFKIILDTIEDFSRRGKLIYDNGMETFSVETPRTDLFPEFAAKVQELQSKYPDWDSMPSTSQSQNIQGQTIQPNIFIFQQPKANKLPPRKKRKVSVQSNQMKKISEYRKISIPYNEPEGEPEKIMEDYSELVEQIKIANDILKQNDKAYDICKNLITKFPVSDSDSE